MLVNFRQGIVSYPVGFLTKVGTPLGSRIALNIPTGEPLTLHFAHRGTNYIVVQKTSVGLTPGVGAFGPLLAGVDYWLYADIDVDTGIVTWGNTTLEPVNQATTPTATQTIISDASPTELVVQAGRHWFKTAASGVPADDLAYPATTMFVRNLANTAWEQVVRVMIAKYEEATFFISVSVNAGNPNTAIKFSGTQAGNLTQNSAGFLIYDSNSVAFKNSDGTFVTTEDVLKTGMLLGADMKVGNYVVQAIAQAAFPAYTIVRFSSFGKVTPVNLFNIDQGFFGLVESSAVIGQQVQVIFEGVVTNSAWAWSQANAPIFVNNSGVLTETDPSINDSEPVAYAISPTQILLRSSRVEVGLVDHATDVDFGAVRLDAFPPTVAGYVDFVFGAAKLLTSTTGLSVTNTYTAQLFIDGVTVNVTYGPSSFPGFPFPTVPTFGDLITFLNTTGLGAAAVASLPTTTALRITSASSGPTSTVRVNSGSAVLPNLDLFESLADYATVDTPVDGFYDSVAASSGSLAAHIADTTVHLSAEQNSLLDLLDAATPGIIVKSAEGAMVSRSITTGISANLVVTNGDGVAGDPVVNLGLLADSGLGTFLKLTRDTWGRVSGTTPVVAGDITALVDATYVNVTGDTMTGALLHAAGTAAAPSISFSGGVGHTDKGLYNSGVDEVSIAIAGAQKVLIDPSGITTFSAYQSGVLSPAPMLSFAGDPTTGIAFSAPMIMDIVISGVPTVSVGPGPVFTHLGSAVLKAADIGGTVQAWDMGLDELASLATNGNVRRTGGVFVVGAVDLTTDVTGALPIVNGGTGASTAAGARTNLGVGTTDSPEFLAVNVGHPTDTTITRVSPGVIAVEGSNVLLASNIGGTVQAWDADLDALAALASTGIVVHTGAGTFAERTVTSTGGTVTITNGDGVAGNINLEVAGFILDVVTIDDTDSPYAVAITDDVILADATSGAITVDLPTPTSGRQVIVKKVDATVNAVTVDPFAAELIDGAVSFVLNNQWDAVTVVSDGSDWFIV